MNLAKIELLPMDYAIYNHLMTVGTITAVEASTLYKVRCMTSNISRLRKYGLQIATSFKKDLTGQRYARYSVQQVAA